MHKKLEAELVSLAHSILQMKNKNDVLALKEKARLLYERLAVLSFVDEYLVTTPTNIETKESLVDKIKDASDEKPELVIDELEELVKNEVVEESIEEEVVVESIEEEVVVVEPVAEEVKEEIEEEVVDVVKEIELETRSEEKVIETTTLEFIEVKKKLTIEEEFRDSVSADVTTNLFAKVEEKTTEVKVSLNDKLHSNIQVGLNDRIAFVKHLFNHSQADFNRVLSQLNSFKSEKEALQFINKMVKPDYDWSGKEEFEERFLGIINRKFL